MTSLSFIRTVNELQVSLLTKKNLIYCKNTRISSKICSFLLQQGLIHKYIITSNSQYELWLKSSNNVKLIKSLYLMSKPSSKKYYSFYKIKTLLWKNKNYIYIISAPHINSYNIFNNNWITQQQAVNLNVGGEILLKIELA
jgi:ribosomal protein S8